MGVSDDASVPPAIGEYQEWEQSRKAMRDGYAAFLDDTPPSANPHRRRHGENFSGYKRRKANDWYAGFQLAAIREGDCESKADVEDAHGVYASLPRSPAKAIYGDFDTAADDVGEWGYRFHSTIYESRHEAIGAAAVDGRDSSLSNPRKALRGVGAVERVRRPLLPGWDGDETDG